MALTTHCTILRGTKAAAEDVATVVLPDAEVVKEAAEAMEVVAEVEVVGEVVAEAAADVVGAAQGVAPATLTREEEGVVDVAPTAARSALRRGVAAVAGQRAAEGVHLSFGCGLAFLNTTPKS